MADKTITFRPAIKQDNNGKPSTVSPSTSYTEEDAKNFSIVNYPPLNS